MNVMIQSPAGISIPDYTLTIEAPSQPYYHTAFRFTGNFGFLELSRADLLNCTIWHINYETDQDITLSGFVKEKVSQLCYLNSDASEATLYMSRIDKESFRLSRSCKEVLCIHYASGFFNSANKSSNGNLVSMFEDDEILSVKANENIRSVCTQILNASPAHRIVHIYLEAKVKELLTLVYRELNPQEIKNRLSEKQLEAVLKAKEIILSDLSTTYSSAELSRLCGINMYSLKKDFKTYYGNRLDIFQHNARMEKATELLLGSSLSIKEIAFAVGYKAVSNFSESFRNHFGYPPSKLRDRNQ